MNFNELTMISSLALMLAVIGAKVATTNHIRNMRSAISLAKEERLKALNELKVAHAKREVTEQKKAQLVQKKLQMERTISKLKKEMASLVKEHRHRQQVKESTRAKLVHLQE